MSVVAGKNQGPGNSKKPKPYQQHAILGFIQAIMMPIRRSKKLNLLIAFSNLISTILFQSILALNLHSKQINLGFFYFKLFICPPDVKRPKSFRYFTPWIPNKTPPWTVEEFTAPRDPDLRFTTFTNSIFVQKTDISKSAWKNACHPIKYLVIGNVYAFILLILTLQHYNGLIHVCNFQNKPACCIFIKKP